MLELAKNGTPDYGNLECGEMNGTVKAEGNTEATTPNREEPTAAPCTTRENTDVVNTGETRTTTETKTPAETTRSPKSNPVSNENRD